jgi:hypothetical protein
MSEFRLLTPEEIDQVPGVITPRPSSFIMVGSVDDDGKVVAAVGAFLVLHADPIWIRPDKRGGGLMRRLWEAGRAELLGRGVENVEMLVGMTDTNPGPPFDAQVERVCLAIGGHEIKARFFAVPVGENDGKRTA